MKAINRIPYLVPVLLLSFINLFSQEYQKPAKIMERFNDGIALDEQDGGLIHADLHLERGETGDVADLPGVPYPIASSQGAATFLAPGLPEDNDSGLRGAELTRGELLFHLLEPPFGHRGALLRALDGLADAPLGDFGLELCCAVAVRRGPRL